MKRVLCFVLGWWLLCASVVVGQVVEIPDSNLRQAVRQVLNLPDNTPITEQDMLGLTGFAAEDAGIENITGLEYAHNLRSLFLRSNPIEDVMPLANLTQLRLLHLAGVLMEDLTFLKDLTELRELYLGYCRITDITPIQNLTKLVLLDLRVNRIMDVGPLANLALLRTLWIDRNRITDFSPLANLTQLTNLTLANNATTDYRPLFGLNLQSVDIDIHKADELASSEIEIPDPNLRQALREALTLPDEVPITQLDMLQLTDFVAEDAGIENITGLEYAHNLRGLFIPSNPIEDLTPLANLTQLRFLHLIGVPMEDLTFLKNLTEIRELYLGYCWITDITPLQNLTKLVRLDLRVNRIVDVGPLANLTALRTLWIDRNGITDFSPLEGLSLTDFRYDQICLIPDLPIQDRIENRNFPSIVQAWGNTILNLPALSREDLTAYHDLFWHNIPFGLHFFPAPPWTQLTGYLDTAIARRDELLARNPNMLFLVEIRQRSGHVPGQYPEDWFGWLRDENGNLAKVRVGEGTYLIDFRLPEVQDIIVEQAIAASKCGLYDGIMFDWWTENGGTLLNYSVDPPTEYSTEAEEREARIAILQRIREAVPDDFLILCNNNHRKLPLSAPYINGSFMETFYFRASYTLDEIIEIETNLIWSEANFREPQINCLRGQGIPTEPPDSPTNRQWMRLFTTMSLTLSDGYALYVTGIWEDQQSHYWYPFWDANLGQPISHTAQRYQEDIEGLYIREFDNGWAVYNRSGNVQEISLPENATGVASGQTSKAHQLPDLDGEIYLKTVAGQPTSPYDLNMDGVVNVLDLILTAQNLGSTEGDINGDGITNILDLILVAQHLGETSTPAAPAALHVSLSPETVQKWIDMAYAQNDGSVIFAQGIAMLERLLALMIPDKTVLRANYPNPFNPETWIPYHLASETEVRISIYDLRGVLVRQFNLGHQKAGYYTDRRKAVYWDGRNEIGEPVSSGIYFYTLTTDDYTGTRRMVILK